MHWYNDVIVQLRWCAIVAFKNIYMETKYMRNVWWAAIHWEKYYRQTNDIYKKPLFFFQSWYVAHELKMFSLNSIKKSIIELHPITVIWSNSKITEFLTSKHVHLHWTKNVCRIWKQIFSNVQRKPIEVLSLFRLYWHQKVIANFLIAWCESAET